MDLGNIDLNHLVNKWHELAGEDGDGIHLLLLANRTKEGDIEVTAVSARDFISAMSGADYQPVKLSIPSVSMTLGKRTEKNITDIFPPINAK